MYPLWYSLLCLIVFPMIASCVSPRQTDTGDHAVPDNESSSSRLIHKIPSPQIIPSKRISPSPPILGVNYVGTIGGPGQGAGQFILPFGLALDRLGHLYVADSGNNRIQVVDFEGNFITEFGSRGWRSRPLGPVDPRGRPRGTCRSGDRARSPTPGAPAGPRCSDERRPRR